MMAGLTMADDRALDGVGVGRARMAHD